MSRIVLGVTGGIAAYKACDLLRRLLGAGHDVTVVPTEAALQFIGRVSWEALSGKPVHTQVWDDAHLVPHVKLGQEADLVFVAPATADLLARDFHGIRNGGGLLFKIKAQVFHLFRVKALDRRLIDRQGPRFFEAMIVHGFVEFAHRIRRGALGLSESTG